MFFNYLQNKQKKEDMQEEQEKLKNEKAAELKKIEETLNQITQQDPIKSKKYSKIISDLQFNSNDNYDQFMKKLSILLDQNVAVDYTLVCLLVDAIKPLHENRFFKMIKANLYRYLLTNWFINVSHRLNESSNPVVINLFSEAYKNYQEIQEEVLEIISKSKNAQQPENEDEEEGVRQNCYSEQYELLHCYSGQYFLLLYRGDIDNSICALANFSADDISKLISIINENEQVGNWLSQEAIKKINLLAKKPSQSQHTLFSYLDVKAFLKLLPNSTHHELRSKLVLDELLRLDCQMGKLINALINDPTEQLFPNELFIYKANDPRLSVELAFHPGLRHYLVKNYEEANTPLQQAAEEASTENAKHPNAYSFKLMAMQNEQYLAMPKITSSKTPKPNS
ncbi:MAG: hypothetical protein KIT27_02710 [Legionellales bacterium]|nr:hypothetical protein [Legionellales bacterium]